jgi:hypothetical protein
MRKIKNQEEPEQLPDMSNWSDKAIHEFWKTHDSADYWDQMQEVQVRAQRKGQRAVSVKLDESDIALLRAIAKRLGLGHTTLIRIWIKEKLREVQTTKG